MKIYFQTRFKKATLKAIENPKVYQYTISNGINELREQIALRYTNEGFCYNKREYLNYNRKPTSHVYFGKIFENKDITMKNLHI